MNLTQFSIPLNNRIIINGEYEGNLESGKVVVFAHGFGVKRDSWGMFNQLGDLIKENFLVVRFDFVEIVEDENATKVFPLKTQSEMLKTVITYVKDELNGGEFNIIAHSQGCLVAGILSPDNLNKIVLLASPIESPYSRMKNYFSGRKGTQINEAGLSSIKRSDGSWTYVESGFWDDMKAIQPVKLYEELSRKTNLFFVRAMQDHVILDKNYEPIKNNKSIQYIELQGNHNFDDDARNTWLNTMVDILKDNS